MAKSGKKKSETVDVKNIEVKDEVVVTPVKKKLITKDYVVKQPIIVRGKKLIPGKDKLSLTEEGFKHFRSKKIV